MTGTWPVAGLCRPWVLPPSWESRPSPLAAVSPGRRGPSAPEVSAVTSWRSASPWVCYRVPRLPLQMAQRLLLRRFLAAAASRKPAQSRWAPLAFSAAQTPPCGPGGHTGTPSPARTLHATGVLATTFNIQDGSDFQDRVVNSETPVVVDFHAQWCGPCKILGPRLEKMVAKQQGKVVMAKVDIDDHTDLALEYEVSAVPTVLAIKNGDVVDKFVGIKDEEQLEAFLKKLIG